MDNTKRDDTEGVITCFLALVMLLVLSLVMSLIAYARANAARVYAEMLADIAASSVLAEYYRPLYDTYHVFGVDAGYGSAVVLRSEIISRLNDYQEYSAVAAEHGASLLSMKIDETTIESLYTLPENGGAAFRRQAVEYAKYRSVSQIVEKLLSSLDIFKKSEATLGVLEAKTSADESLAEIDKAVLLLIEKVDGIKSDEDGIKRRLNGEIKLASKFVKKCVVQSVTKEYIGIDHEILFNALYTKYVNPYALLDDYKTSVSDYVSIKERIAVLNTEAELTEELTEKMKLEAEAALLTVDSWTFYWEARSCRADLEDLNEGCLDAVNEALVLMDVIEAKRILAESEINTYADILATAAEWMDIDLITELSQELSKMQSYIGKGVQGEDIIYDFDLMKETLYHNKEILEELSIKDNIKVPDPEEFIKFEETIAAMRELYSGYSFEGLRFDYSSIQLQPEGESPAASAMSSLSSGLIGLLLNKDLSDKKISSLRLPSLSISNSAAAVSEEVTFDSGMFTKIKEAVSADSIDRLLIEGTSEFTETVFFLMYMDEHFTNYMDESEEGVLDYQLEYILYGNVEDGKNVEAFLLRVLLIRTMMCLIHVISDSNKTGQAKAFATTVLGFTGMPALIAVLKYVIILVWSFEEAMAETAAIASGKKVSLIPADISFQTKFEELALISKASIKAKAEMREKDTGVTLGYEEYLYLFLILQDKSLQNLRCLDIIQSQIRCSNNNFFIENCICGLTFITEYTLVEIFPKVSRPGANKIKGYNYNIRGGSVYS